MKALAEVTPTPEQLALFSRTRPGVEVIRGAAGSGKTTTAVLKLRQAVGFFVNRFARRSEERNVNVLILTFNRTLRGYVSELATKQIENGDGISLEITTFARWAMDLLHVHSVLNEDAAHDAIKKLGQGLPFDPQFMIDETEYILGRFMPDDIPSYLTARREGRGAMPRMERPARELFLSTVVLPYQQWKRQNTLTDWNDLAVRLAGRHVAQYDVIVVDETQDFSANQVRAVMAQAAPEHTVTFVLDSIQRIYARSFTWQEVGISVRPENSSRLTHNYRNTREIAQFAASVLNGLALDDDGSMPDLSSATRTGPLPMVLQGIYSQQVDYAIQFIRDYVDLEEETVAFLHPKGWFTYLQGRLNHAGLPYVGMTRNNEWPQGPENIALSTLHSAKGLEFDHVLILGLNDEVVAIQEGEHTNADEQFAAVRRLLAMGIGRARKTIIVGYKLEDRPRIASFFESAQHELVSL
ncbi:MAG: AAA family ATPase [Ramlibacter sp.]|nr:AAA family ATPase [Ramlibacter sp.]